MGTIKATNIEPIADNGTVTLGSSGDTITVPSGVTVAGGLANTPSFKAYMNSTQTVSSEVYTKLQIDTEVWDTDNCYDSTTNYRFTPTVAGKYFVYGAYRYDTGSADQVRYAEVIIYKNGSPHTDGTQIGNFGTYTFRNMLLPVTSLIEFNGTTDYVELFMLRDTASGTNVNGGSRYTYFGAYKIIG